MSRTEILADRYWQIAFVWHGDRWAHTIAAVVGDRLVPLLDSREGTPVDRWPASPPLSDLHRQDARGANTVMLLGMAGRSHWSVTVQLSEGDRAASFQVACRIHAEWPAAAAPDRGAWPLGSRYRSSVCPRQQSPQAAWLAEQDLAVQLVAGPVADAPPGPPVTIATADHALDILPGPQGNSLPRTVRWNYCLTQTDTPGPSAIE
ncbi:MAG: hypothetical protein GTO03_00160 [Planctomycetales bacterium]|nr:hypothetical protein [Planctomycetales bacterium]